MAHDQFPDQPVAIVTKRFSRYEVWRRPPNSTIYTEHVAEMDDANHANRMVAVLQREYVE